MPVKSINYTDSVFYKIVCRDLTITELYVGHTTNFRLRKSQHKHACNKEQSNRFNLRVYQFIRENGGWENWDIILIIKKGCVDALEARTIERGYIETLGATLNCQVPSRTSNQYYLENVATIKENASEYRALHKDETFEYNTNYYVENKEAILASQAEYYKLNRERIIATVKTYAGNNKEKITEFHKGYYERNKEVIKERSRKTREKKKLLKQESLGSIN
jgi:hypothetical protein